ncbi:MAG: hypothetical protein P1U86_12330 [Verrucomicrobiales bacterium]|nr:hypothetical protein [Verrucomicrobiales bacterium]MEC5127307.1 hypothetical protein [Verrucomicrobiales bacterium BCK34]
MNSFWADMIVKMSLPLATRWVEKQESVIMREGRPLSEWETMWAQDVGVSKPEEVRILPVPRIPTPGSWITRIFGVFGEGPTGMAVNYGIYLEASNATNPSLLVHELTHVAQFERMGGIGAFLEEYIYQCVSDGYWDCAMEQEARDAAAPFSRPPGG